MAQETYYKVLAADGCSPAHGGTGEWFLPEGKHAGKWMPAVKPILCKSGYHFVTLNQLPHWIGPTLYELEVRGKILRANDKSVAAQARLIRRVDTWNEKTLRIFAADCAEHVLGIYEKMYPNDDRPRKAIQAARNFANVLIDASAAAAAAAEAAYAAYGAAPASAYATYAAYDAFAAAPYAAYDAAAAAGLDASYAAYGAAFAVERKWQVNRLKYYLEVE